MNRSWADWPTISTEDAKWLAGVFDARGNAYFTVSKPTKRRGETPALMTIFSTKNSELLNEVRRLTARPHGSQVRSYERRADAIERTAVKRPCRKLGVTCTGARNLLKSIRPFVRVKMDMIDKALQEEEAYAYAKSEKEKEGATDVTRTRSVSDGA